MLRPARNRYWHLTTHRSFSIILSEDRRPAYRPVRMAIEPSIAPCLSKNCGDKDSEAMAPAVGLLIDGLSLYTHCSPEEMTEGRLALRSDPRSQEPETA